MATGKEQYYALDDIGFIGDQKRTEAQVQRGIKRFSWYLKALKAGKLNPEARVVRPKSKSK